MLHTVQEFMLPPEGAEFPSSLYVRRSEGSLQINEGSITALDSADVGFDTFFNSFYEEYWAEYTEITDLFLEVEFSGALTLEVLRDKDDRVNSVITRTLSSSSRQHETFPVTQVSATSAGRLFVRASLGVECRVFALRFKTSTTPKRAVELTLGYCTFNREGYLLRNLQRLRRIAQEPDASVNVIVVNQGKPFEPELAELFQTVDEFHMVEQPNLGGSGGFARSILEAFRQGATHHVLLDDDAVLDAGVIRRILCLLAFVRDGLAVGGQMLDLFRPTLLCESGGVVKEDGTYESLFPGLDVSSPDCISQLNGTTAVDYNAWWFFAFSLNDARACGLPLPIFIHVDDVEYGIRLQQFGIQTFSMPGIAVWHEPFYTKDIKWQLYYDLRNRLIMAAAYPLRFKLPKPTTEILWWMLEPIALNNYTEASLLSRAVSDFLEGPALLSGNSEALHRKVLALVRRPDPVNTEPTIPDKSTVRAMPESDAGIALLLIWRIISSLLWGRADKYRLLKSSEVNIANVDSQSYVRVEETTGRTQLYRFDRGETIRALITAIVVWVRYSTRRRSVSSIWLKGVPLLYTKDFWIRSLDKWSRDQKS